MIFSIFFSQTIDRFRLSPDLRLRVYNRFKQINNVSQTAREFGIERNTIKYIKKKFENFGTFEDLPPKPRKRKTDRHDDLNILREITNSPKKKPRDIRADLNLKCSNRTVSRRIKERGLNPRVAAVVPYISDRNKTKRLRLAKSLINKPKKFWERVVWSDEKSLNY